MNNDNLSKKLILSLILEQKGLGLIFLFKVQLVQENIFIQCFVSSLRAKEKIVLCVVSSGIASLLLPGGRTSHSRLRIPLNLHESSICNISKNSELGNLLRQVTLLIWDEVPMQHRFCFEAVDRMVQDIRDSDQLFGGLPVVMGGDFAQILPVVHRGTRATIVRASIQRSYIWLRLTLLFLRKNMRLLQNADSQEFAT